ncbi:unnamed protein product, partial [Owenia fusiformis]
NGVNKRGKGGATKRQTSSSSWYVEENQPISEPPQSNPAEQTNGDKYALKSSGSIDSYSNPEPAKRKNKSTPTETIQNPDNEYNYGKENVHEATPVYDTPKTSNYDSPVYSDADMRYETHSSSSTHRVESTHYVTNHYDDEEGTYANIQLTKGAGVAVRAIFDYYSQEEDELTLKEGKTKLLISCKRFPL